MLYRTFLCFAISLMLVAAPAHAQEDELTAEGFQNWLDDIRVEAGQKGISNETLFAVLENIEFLPRVVELDGKQPERTLTFQEYRKRVIPNSRVRRAKRLLQEHNTLLADVAKKYGVQARFIVALWGVESDFGKRMGGFYVPSALGTLAYEGRRSEFFTKEFFHALKILDDKHINEKDMLGSWAGAMGQTQFMPSSFLNFAEDYNGDGRKDIWTTRSDVFASIANYLVESGWDKDQTWGRKVTLPADFPQFLVGLEQKKKLAEWNKLGVRREDGRSLPVVDLEASIVLPGGKREDAYLVYDNYRVLLKWNRSQYFATAVGLLSDGIAY